MKFISPLLVAGFCGMIIISCKSNSTDSSANSQNRPTFDLRGTWVEDTTDELHKYRDVAPVTLTITTNDNGQVGTAIYPSVGVSYPVTLFASGTYYRLNWGPAVTDFGNPIHMARIFVTPLWFDSLKSPMPLVGTLSWYNNYGLSSGEEPDKEMRFTKK